MCDNICKIFKMFIIIWESDLGMHLRVHRRYFNGVVYKAAVGDLDAARWRFSRMRYIPKINDAPQDVRGCLWKRFRVLVCVFVIVCMHKYKCIARARVVVHSARARTSPQRRGYQRFFCFPTYFYRVVFPCAFQFWDFRLSIVWVMKSCQKYQFV